MNRKIAHPMIALAVIFGIGALLAKYGVERGSAMLFCMFAGIMIYKFFTFRS